MSLFGRRRPTFIGLDIVERALDPGERRAPEPRRGGDADPSKSEKRHLLAWALTAVGALAVALGLAGANDWKADYRNHKVIEDGRHADTTKAINALAQDLALRKEREAWRDRLTAAMARKLGVKVYEIEEPAK